MARASAALQRCCSIIEFTAGRDPTSAMTVARPSHRVLTSSVTSGPTLPAGADLGCCQGQGSGGQKRRGQGAREIFRIVEKLEEKGRVEGYRKRGPGWRKLHALETYGKWVMKRGWREAKQAAGGSGRIQKEVNRKLASAAACPLVGARWGWGEGGVGFLN